LVSANSQNKLKQKLPPQLSHNKTNRFALLLSSPFRLVVSANQIEKYLEFCQREKFPKANCVRGDGGLATSIKMLTTYAQGE